MSGALYNEIEPFAVQWLRNLSAAGHIAPGAVEPRSIRELTPEGSGNAIVAQVAATFIRAAMEAA